MNSFGQSERFKKGIGSSLSYEENVFVRAGGVAFHKKGERDTKVFVLDDNKNEKERSVWSVTVKNSHLADLKSKLKEVGYLLPAA